MNALFKPPSQSNEAASPPPRNKAEPPGSSETMSSIVARLTKLRETYLEELKIAREKVKKNFLK